MNWNWLKSAACGLGLLTSSVTAYGQGATTGYPERVIRWKVEGAESCADIAEAVYGSGAHQNLVLRYNNVPCHAGTPLKKGLVLVLPERVTELPTAVVTYVNPDTRSRPAGGDWSTAQAGQELGQRSEVNTHEAGMAGIQFSDATRLFLNENTLVIIYDTADRSARVGTPPKVSLKSGELQAGLSALSGRDVVVELPNRARVKASSSDTVVRRDAKKTNVSVFDGSAEVTSAGKKVRVPKNFGSKVIHRKPPEKPRPLPPAPEWEPSIRFTALAPNGEGTLSLQWSEVKEAKSYRVEVSRTDDFQQLVARQRVPAEVLRLRAEKFPAGLYYVRVRAIDADDFLGISSQVARLALVPATWKTGFGKVDSQQISGNLYSTLVLGQLEQVEVQIDGGAVQPLPVDVELGRMRPEKIRVVTQQGGSDFEVSLAPVDASLQIESEDGEWVVQGRVDLGADQPLIRMDPELILFDGQGNEFDRISVQLGEGGQLTERVERGKTPFVRVELRGSYGELLASDTWREQVVSAPQKPPRERSAPGDWIRPTSRRLGTSLFSSRMPKRAEVRARLDGVSQDAVGSFDVRVSGAWGRLLAEAEFDLFQVPQARASDDVLGLGLGWRLGKPRRWSFAPALRGSLSLAGDGTRPILSPTFAWGSPDGDVFWNGHVQVDIRTIDASQHQDRFSARVLQALYWRLPHQFLAYGQLDAHLLLTQGDSFLPRGGLGAGLRWGRIWFVFAGGRVAPWSDVGEGHLSGQLATGATFE